MLQVAVVIRHFQLAAAKREPVVVSVDLNMQASTAIGWDLFCQLVFACHASNCYLIFLLRQAPFLYWFHWLKGHLSSAMRKDLSNFFTSDSDSLTWALVGWTICLADISVVWFLLWIFSSFIRPLDHRMTLFVNWPRTRLRFLFWGSCCATPQRGIGDEYAWVYIERHRTVRRLLVIVSVNQAAMSFLLPLLRGTVWSMSEFLWTSIGGGEGEGERES